MFHIVLGLGNNPIELWWSSGSVLGKGKLWLREFSTLGCIFTGSIKVQIYPELMGMEKTHRKAFQNPGVHEKCHCVVHAGLYGDTQAG